MRIFLVGFMGSGKTTIGRKLSQRLGFTFIDQDDLIEETAGMTIPEIFSKEGEDGFRNREHQAIKELLSRDNVVVATGGGAPCFFNNMQLYNQNGITIYLKMPPAALASRLKDSATERPLIKNKSESELISYIQNTLEERKPYYEQATYTIKGIHLQVTDVIKIVDLI